MQESLKKESLQRASVTDTLTAAQFFARAKQRLNLDVPPGLNDPNVTPARGDHDADPVM
jgi:hypothetical protein